MVTGKHIQVGEGPGRRWQLLGMASPMFLLLQLLLIARPAGASHPLGTDGAMQGRIHIQGTMSGQGLPRMIPMHLVQGGPRIVFGGMPVMMIRGHHGFDPFEDLQHNMHKAIQQQSTDGDNQDADGAASLERKLGGLVSMFGDHHAGQVGRSEGSFEVDDDHETRLRITALLPGYNLGDAHDLRSASESPLSVQAVGRSSLVVRGTQQEGFLVRTWQRTFALPKHSDLEKIAVTYNSKSGNLTVEVPRKEKTGEEDEEEEDDEGDDADLDDMLPPVLRAIQQGLPGLLSQLAAGGHGPVRVIMSGPSLRGSGGFLAPPNPMMLPGGGEDPFAQLLSQVEQLHPRFHPPPGGERPPPENVDLQFLGCFAEGQLDAADLKYYGESNAASFNAMFWHAKGDDVPYFAMSRHGEPKGHAFTAHGFAHTGEKPKWGVYDGCGTQCSDDSSRWCGCSNEGERGYPNEDCDESEKRFAVYQIKPGAASEPAEEIGEVELEDGKAEAVDADKAAAGVPEASPSPAPQPATKSTTSPAPNRYSPAPASPYWQLQESGDSPGIEIVLPKGLTAKASGKTAVWYNESVAEAPDAAKQLGEIQAHGGDVLPAAGKMKLPAEVSGDDCTWEESRTTADSRVLRCPLARNMVRQLPIKIVDEL